VATAAAIRWPSTTLKAEIAELRELVRPEHNGKQPEVEALIA